MVGPSQEADRLSARRTCVGALVVFAACGPGGRGNEQVEPKPHAGEQDIDDAEGVSHLDGPDELRAAVGIGDVDGDGFDDVMLVGEDLSSHGPEYDPDDAQGRIYLVYGRHELLTERGALEDAADAVFTVPHRSSEFTVAPLGDIDGDGLPDVAISHRDSHRSYHSSELPEASLFIVRGRRGRWSGAVALADATVALELETGHIQAGSAGDIDGDRRPDLWVLVGASNGAAEYPEASSLRMFRTAPERLTLPLDLDAADSVIVSDDSDESLLFASSLSDFDGDAVDDLVVQSWANGVGSRLSMFYGAADGWPDSLFLGDAHAWVEMPAWVPPPTVGDVRNDGHEDLIFVQHHDFAGGPAWLVPGGFGRMLGSIPLGSSDESLCLSSLAILGDVDGDGLNDVAGALCPIGAPEAEDELAIAYGWPEAKSTLESSDVDAIFRTTAEYAWMPPAGIGDFNGDGFADYVIVNEFVGTGQDEASGVHLVYGAPR